MQKRQATQSTAVGWSLLTSAINLLLWVHTFFCRWWRCFGALVAVGGAISAADCRRGGRSSEDRGKRQIRSLIYLFFCFSHSVFLAVLFCCGICLRRHGHFQVNILPFPLRPPDGLAMCRPTKERRFRVCVFLPQTVPTCNAMQFPVAAQRPDARDHGIVRRRRRRRFGKSRRFGRGR